MEAAEILVVDDDPSLREVVRYSLARAGFGVREASDGVQALEMVAQVAPDLIVLDVLMPEMDGLEAAVACARAAGCPSCSCPPRTRSWTRSWAWSWAATTTWPSRYDSTSYWLACMHLRDVHSLKLKCSNVHRIRSIHLIVRFVLTMK